MPESAVTEQLAQEALENSPHYVKAVTDLGDKQDVVAEADIYSENGIKLVSQGTRIRSDLYEKLTRHRLKDALDNLLSTNPATTGSVLLEDVLAQRNNEPVLALLGTLSSDPLSLRQDVGQLQLPKTVALKLTVMREQRRSLYEHTIRVLIICHYIALRLPLNAKDRVNLVMAAICHDFGELHTDPDILRPEHRVTQDERRFIYVHPITAYLVLKQIKEWGSAATAVLYHHERLDGSGYPYGLRGEQLGQLSRILAVAEVAASFIHRLSLQRLATVLQLSQLKFDANVIGPMVEAAHRERSDGNSALILDNVESYLQQIGQLLSRWQEWREVQPGELFREDGPLNFLHERMRGLQSAILQMGFDPRTPSSLLDTQDDPLAAVELDTLVNEIEWQVGDLEHEIDRRMDTLSSALDMMQWASVQEWQGHLHQLSAAKQGVASLTP